jgi:hypothetical protein
MRFSWAAGAALLLVGGIAQADEAVIPGQPDPNKTGVGIGVICNTSDQAEHYVSLRAGGADVTPAVSAVNQEARDPRACGLAAVAFQRDKMVDAKSMQGKLVTIVRISVLAGYNGHEWLRLPAMVQYAVMEAQEGESI